MLNVKTELQKAGRRVKSELEIKNKNIVRHSTLKGAGPNPRPLKEKPPWGQRAKPTRSSSKGNQSEGMSLLETARGGGKG